MKDDRIDAVIKTLNSIEVRGKENLDMLLGCILALEHLDDEEAEAE